MGYFNKLSEELGSGTGKSINWTVAMLVGGSVAVLGSAWAYMRPGAWVPPKNGNMVHHNTWRIAVLSLLAAMIFTSNLVTFSFSHPEKRDGKKVGVLIQLKGHSPPIPQDSWFESGDQEVLVSGSLRYLRYQDDGSEYPIMRLKQKECAIVPAGKNVWLISETRPIDAINMNEVSIYPQKDISPETRWEKMTWPLFGQPERLEVSWLFANKNWHLADTSRGLKTSAKTPKNIPYPHKGGLVCF